MLKFKRIILFGFIFSPLFSYGQKENSYWYFGRNAGVHFLNGTVVAKTDGNLNSNEGCATISDTAGNLLFYTDGTYIWNKLHNKMPNGSGLRGNGSSTQSAMIVRKPNSMDIYYVITVNGISGNTNWGAFYSEIDMRLDNGRGDVISSAKNIPLQNTTDEKITAVLHANGHDIWLIIPERNPRIINTYLLTDNGINLTPIQNITNAGSLQSLGYIRVSPNGKKLAMAALYPSSVNYVMFGDFDFQNGRITNTDTIQIDRPYGIEFSPNNEYLYVGFENTVLGLCQFDLKSGNKNAIKLSRYDLLRNNTFKVGCLYLGIDRKIYFARPGQKYLGCIEKPDLPKNFSSVNTQAVNLLSANANYGLQNCLYSLPRKIEISAYLKLVKCSNQLSFSIAYSDYVSSVKWDFGDSTVDPVLNTDSFINTKHTYYTVAKYKVKVMVVYKDGKKDTLFKNIDVLPVPNLGIKKCNADTLYKCPDDFLSFGCVYPKAKYLWNSGDTVPYLFTKETGVYSVQIHDSIGCTHQQITTVSNYLSQVDIGPDLTLCENDSSSIGVKNPRKYQSFLWNTGAVDSIIKVFPDKVYHVASLDKNNCPAFDTMTVWSKPLPKLKLGNDTSFCEGGELNVTFNEANVNYYLNGILIPSPQVSLKAGQYIVRAEKAQCSIIDKIEIKLIPIPQIDLGLDDSICMDGSKVLDAGTAETYVWNTGFQSRYLPVYRAGEYRVVVSNGQCSNTDTVRFDQKHVNVFIPNAFSPNDDGINETYQLNEGTYIKAFYIYNTWGECVFSSTDANAHWDGTYKGEICQQGIYMVLVAYWDCQHRVQYRNEAIHLLR